jgi:predicted Zn-dependent protease
MAKRRSREQIDADKIIKEYLNELGEKVYQQATETSRRYRKVAR